MKTRILGAAVITAAMATGAARASAEPIGTFSWQLQPYCNRVTVSVVRDGTLYTLDGWDDQCGAGQRAPVVGVATPTTGARWLVPHWSSHPSRV